MLDVWVVIWYYLWWGEGNDTPLQYSCLENPMDRGTWWATVHGVAKSQTRLSDFTFTFHFPALEKKTATHSSVLAWRIPGMGKPGGLRSMGSHRVGHDWSDLAAAWCLILEEDPATHSSILAWRIPMDRGAWQATVHWVAKSQTRLKRLSSSSREIGRYVCMYLWKQSLCACVFTCVRRRMCSWFTLLYSRN